MLQLMDMPVVQGVSFRSFRGEADYPAMVEVINAANEADQIEEIATVEELANDVNHFQNCDPHEDMLFAQGNDGRVAGYGRVWWWVNDEGERLYGAFRGRPLRPWPHRGPSGRDRDA